MEKYNWDLSALYESLDAQELERDLKILEEMVNKSQEFFSKKRDDVEFLKEGIALIEKVEGLSIRFFSYLNLVLATNTSDTKAHGTLSNARKLVAPFSGFMVGFSRRLEKLDLEVLIGEADLSHYGFVIKELKERGYHLLSEKEEEIIAQTNIYGVNAWENLFDQTTSKAMGQYRGEKKSLAELRNLAYDPDPQVRKEAYEAELAIYPKIEDTLASSLNSIKGHVNYMARKRGYKDSLDQALDISRMKRETCHALIHAMEEKLEIFHRYFKAKARLLGQEKLLWQDLFAPVGKLPVGYSVPLSKKALVDSFMPLHPPIAHLIERAYEEKWIDFFPKEGKVGGAFCENLGYIKESRILTNFDGSFTSVDTLAHELGHAYHGYLIENKPILNQEYSMPVAETASTFNEIHFLLEVLEKAQSSEDKLGLLENFLMGNAQTICDIYSRFLFEKEVFERVDRESLGAKDLCQIMHSAQIKAYGDGVEEESLHPYMWACKGHYYSASLSYYNFPYAFGSLYAMAIYKKALKEGPEFMKKYDEMLAATTTSTCEEVAEYVGLDIRDKNFWKESMENFLPYVEEFEKMV